MSKHKFIITADDYGMCSIVDRAIEDCARAGLLSTTNVIVNQGDFTKAKKLKKEFPHLSIGLHWNVTDGFPLNDRDDVSSLVDSETGQFWGVSDFISRFKKGQICKKELRKELILQYNAFKSICGEPDYWNVHMNSSLDFKTFPFFNSLALELGIMKTRSFRRVYIQPKGLHGLKNCIREFVKKFVLDIWFGFQIPKTGTKMPEGRLIYFDSHDKTKDIRNIGENVRWGGKKIVELVIHPSISADYHNFGTLTTVRVDEWKMFTDASTRLYLEQQGIEIVNFEEI